MQTLITDLERLAPRPIGDPGRAPGREPVTNTLDSAMVTGPHQLETMPSPNEGNDYVHIR
jgi:hypothetical protein